MHDPLARRWVVPFSMKEVVCERERSRPGVFKLAVHACTTGLSSPTAPTGLGFILARYRCYLDGQSLRRSRDELY